MKIFIKQLKINEKLFVVTYLLNRALSYLIKNFEIIKLFKNFLNGKDLNVCYLFEKPSVL